MFYVIYTDCQLVTEFVFRKQNKNRCCYLWPFKQHQSHQKNYIVAAERKNGGNVLKTTELGKFTVSDMVLAFSCNVRIVNGKDTDPSDITGILAYGVDVSMHLKTTVNIIAVINFKISCVRCVLTSNILGNPRFEFRHRQRKYFSSLKKITPLSYIRRSSSHVVNLTTHLELVLRLMSGTISLLPNMASWPVQRRHHITL